MLKMQKKELVLEYGPGLKRDGLGKRGDFTTWEAVGIGRPWYRHCEELDAVSS